MKGPGRPGGHLAVVLVLGLILAVSPSFGIPTWDVPLAVTVLLFGVAATGLNLMFGYGGMLSLGNASFMGIAAYVMGLAAQHLGIPAAVGMLLGVAGTALVAALVGLVFVRIPGVYFAVGTLALAVAFEGLIRAAPGITGGATGLTIRRELDLGVTVIASDTGWYVLTVLLAFMAAATVYYCGSARTGRVLHLVRHDQLAAGVLGVHVAGVKLVIFVTAATLTGFSGALMFLWQGVVIPESAGMIRSVELVAMAVIGGVGSWSGAFLGAFVLEWINDLVRTLGSFRELIYGLLFLLIVLFAQGGVRGLLVGAYRRVTQMLGRTKGEQRGEEAVGAEGRSATGGSTAVPQRPSQGTQDRSLWDAGGPLDGLEVAELSKRFGGVTAVDRVDVRVPRGAVTGLIGANGAGKSTLMNIISGVEVADAGRVLLGGQDITELQPAARALSGLARTFQVPRLVPGLSVLENICLGEDARRRRVFRRTAAEEHETLAAARAALAAAELSHLADRPARTLGSGERKFVELVRALAWEPAVLLMDEPGVGLVHSELFVLHRWIDDLREQNTAVLLIDHNMDFIGQIADFVYLIDQGRIVARGAPREVVEVLKGTAVDHAR